MRSDTVLVDNDNDDLDIDLVKEGDGALTNDAMAGRDYNSNDYHGRYANGSCAAMALTQVTLTNRKEIVTNRKEKKIHPLPFLHLVKMMMIMIMRMKKTAVVKIFNQNNSKK